MASSREKRAKGVAGNLTVHHKHFPSQHGFSTLNKPSIESGTDGYVKKNSACKISHKVSHTLKDREKKIKVKPSFLEVCLEQSAGFQVVPHKCLFCVCCGPLLFLFIFMAVYCALSLTTNTSPGICYLCCFREEERLWQVREHGAGA